MNIFNLKTKMTKQNNEKVIREVKEVAQKCTEDQVLLDEAISENNSLARELEVQQMKLQKNELSLSRLQSELSDEKADKEVLEKRIKKIKLMNQEQESSLKDLSDQKQLVLKSIVSLKEKVRKLSEIYGSKVDEINKVKLELATLKGEEGTLKSKRDVLNGNKICNNEVREGVRTQVKETKKRIAKMLAMIEADNEEIKNVEDQIDILNKERIVLDSEISSLLEKSQKVKSDKDEKITQYERMKYELSASKEEKDELEKTLARQVAEIQEVHAKNQSLKKTMMKLRTRVTSLEAESKELKCLEKSEKSQLNELEKLIKEKEKKKSELESDLQLLKNESGRFTKEIKEFRNKEKEISARLVELKETEGRSLVELDDLDRLYKKTKKEHELILADSISREKRVRELENDVERLVLSINELNTKKGHATANCLNRERQIASLEDQIKNESNQIKDLRLEINDLKGRESELREVVFNLDIEKRRLNKSKEELEDKTEKLRKSIDLLALKLEKSTRNRDILTEEIQEQDNLMEILLEDEKRINQSNNETLLQIGNLKGRIQVGENRIDSKGEEIKNLAQENTRLNRIADDLCKKLDITVKQLEGVEEKVAIYEDKISQVEIEIRNNEEVTNENLNVISQLEDKFIELKDLLSRKEQKLYSLKANSKRIDKIKIKKLKTKDELENKVEELESHIKNEVEKFEKLLTQKKTIDDNIKLLEVEVSENEEKEKKLISEFEVIESMISASEKKIVDLEDAKARQEDKLNEFSEKRDLLLTKHKDLNNQQIISDEELTKVENDCYNLRSVMATLEAEIEEAEYQLESNLSRKIQLNEEIKKVSLDTKEAKKELVKLNSEIEKSGLELGEIENVHQEKLDLLQVELDEKKILEKELGQKKNKLNIVINETKAIQETLEKLALDKETMQNGINSATTEKGEYLVKKDELLKSLTEKRQENKKARKLLEGMKIEVSELRKEYNLVNAEYDKEINRTKHIVNSLETLRGQARTLKNRKAQNRHAIKNAKLQSEPIMAELHNTEKQIQIEEVQSDLEIALSKIEFDANLLINDNAIEMIKEAKYQTGFVSYIESLPFVFSKIELVKIVAIPSGDLSITVTGTLRCEEELTKELLKDNVRGKFANGVRFKINENSIRLVVLVKRESLGLDA